MKMTIEIPDAIARHLETRWESLERRSLELLATEAYRDRVITVAEVRQMLKLSSRWEAHEFLKKEGAYLQYTLADLEQDVEAIGIVQAKVIRGYTNQVRLRGLREF